MTADELAAVVLDQAEREGIDVVEVAAKILGLQRNEVTLPRLDVAEGAHLDALAALHGADRNREMGETDEELRERLRRYSP